MNTNEYLDERSRILETISSRLSGITRTCPRDNPYSKHFLAGKAQFRIETLINSFTQIIGICIKSPSSQNFITNYTGCNSGTPIHESRSEPTLPGCNFDLEQMSVVNITTASGVARDLTKVERIGKEEKL